MFRIYLDKMTISYLKDQKRPQDVALLKWFEDRRSFTTVVFSDALMDDLANGYDENNDRVRDKTNEDLELIFRLTEGNCFSTQLNDTNPQWSIKNPALYFENFKQKDQTEYTDFAQLIESLIETAGDAGTELKSQLESLRNLPIPKVPDDVKNTPIGKILSGNNILEIAANLLNFSNSIQKDPKILKELRTFTQQSLKIGNLSDSKVNPISKLNDSLLSTPLKKDFNGFNEMVLQNNNNNKKPITDWDKISTAFSNLDMLGFNSDKLSSGYGNYLNDIRHTNYAGHCDFFITEDKKTSEKAKLIYEKENIGTRVFTAAEFIEFIKDFTFEFNLSFIDSVFEYCQDQQPEVSYCSIDDKTEIKFWQLKKPVINFFNQLVQYTPLNKSPTLFFSRKPTNFAKFAFNSEIKKMVDFFVAALGEDFLSRGTYQNEREDLQILEGNWNGRLWFVNSYGVHINIQKEGSWPIFTVKREN